MNNIADIETDQHSPDTPEGDARPKRRRWPWILALLILAAAAIPAWLAMDATRKAGNEQAIASSASAAQTQALSQTREQLQALDRQLQSLSRDLDELREAQQQLAKRMDGSRGTNQVLREEVLGMGERATVLEDAVARLAQNRISGESTLRLNEAELLLSMGTERLSLFADRASALQTFTLAEDILSGLDDPALASLRQTLAEELAQLRQMPADNRPEMRAELAMLARQIDSLPPVRKGDVIETDGNASRWQQLLGQWITVRRVDPEASVLGPSQLQAALAAIALQLELAQTALVQADETAFRDALNRADATAATLFDQEANSVRDWRSRLETLRNSQLRHEIPALGATTRELRNLRAVRQINRGPSVDIEQLPSSEPETPDHDTPLGSVGDTAKPQSGDDDIDMIDTEPPADADSKNDAADESESDGAPTASPAADDEAAGDSDSDDEEDDAPPADRKIHEVLS